MNTGRPFPGVFSVNWDGYLLVEEDGNYEFSLNSDDGSLLYINDELIIDNGGTHGSRMMSNSIFLNRGANKINIRFQDFGGGAVMELYWRKPGEDKDIIHSKYLVVTDDGILK